MLCRTEACTDVASSNDELCSYCSAEKQEEIRFKKTWYLEQTFGDLIFDQFFNSRTSTYITTPVGHAIKKNLMALIAKDAIPDNERIDIINELQSAMNAIADQVELWAQ